MVRERGFTLIEFLVVLGIMSLALALVVPAIGAGSPGAQADSTAQELAAGLRRTRAAAIAAGNPADFTLDVANRTFASGDQDLQSVAADSVRLTLYTATGTVANRTTGAIRFFPDGTSTGGGIAVESGDVAVVVAVDWLAGAVAIRHRDADGVAE